MSAEAEVKRVMPWPPELLDDPNVRSPLGPLGGAVPPAPGWFAEAVGQEPERSRFELEGAGIELLCWGELGKPGLLLLHGNGAHAEWWSFIAPFFAADHRVAALSWSGMGGSDWRPAYALDQYGREALRAIELAGLDRAGPPQIVGHSFGGLPTMHLFVEHPGRVGGAVLIDSFIPRPGERRGPRPSGDGPPAYPTPEAALARFRFAPPQPCENLFIADWIARRSLRRADDGWRWRFDPRLWANMDRTGADTLYDRLRRPVHAINGDRSLVVTAEQNALLRELLPSGSRIVEIPNCAHHVMVDQPLAMVAALRALLD